MPDTDTLIKDVKTHADGSATLLAALGALYLDGPPPVDTYPYWFVSEYRPSQTDNAFGAGYTEKHNVEIQILGEDAATTFGYQDTLHARFDRATITPTSGRIIECERMFAHRRKTSLVSKNNKPVYQTISRYRITVDKQR